MKTLPHLLTLLSPPAHKITHGYSLNLIACRCHRPRAAFLSHRQHLETRTATLDTLHTLLTNCLEQRLQRGKGTLICNCNREEIGHEMQCATDTAAVFRLCTALKIRRIEFWNSAKHFYLQKDSSNSNLLVCQNCVSHTGECAECELPGGIFLKPTYFGLRHKAKETRKKAFC